jgi:hypothetical protein
MTNFGALLNSVQRNCHISDARFAGEHTMCVFLLKMRELYRWEHDIPLSRPLPKDDVGRWLEQRERLWSNLESSTFEDLPLDDAPADPFDSDAVNRELVPQGYVYSGGYGRHSKPHFFLGRLERVEAHDGCTVLVSSCEYARDLDAPPAMLQGRTIYVRLESLRRYLWEKIEESNWSRSREAMDRALDAYRFADGVDAALDRMTEAESRVAILHELGEARAGELLGGAWNDMLLALSNTRAEIMVRAVRDILADALVTLPVLVAQENWPSLHFYFANFGGMRRHLHPDLMQTYHRAAAERSLPPLRTRLEIDGAHWLATARNLVSLHGAGGPQLAETIERTLLPANADTHCQR